MEDIIIIGVGGVGRETAAMIEYINNKNPTWNLLGFVDDDKALLNSKVNGYAVLGPIELLNTIKKETFIICSISNPNIKKAVLSRISNAKLQFTKLIHPTAIISADCEMGNDIIIQANCVITTNVRIGSHVQINPQSGIGHESIINDYCSLYWNVNISGRVVIEEGCLLGTKSTILQGLTIARGCTIGAGAVVTKSLPSDCTAVGIPARPIQK